MTATLEQTLYRSLVDEEFRALLAANPTCSVSVPLAARKPWSPSATRAWLARRWPLATYQACKNTCGWGLTMLCDKMTT